MVVLAHLVTLLALLTLNFALPRAMPGDPIAAAYTEGSSGYVYDDTARESLRAYYGLDRSLPEQYGAYLAGLLSGDLGTSVRYQVPVAELVGARLPRTLILVGAALIVGTPLGLLAGVAAGWRRGAWPDTALLLVFTALRSVPAFLLATLLLLFLSVRLGWFPISGSSSPFNRLGPAERLLDGLHHLALPALVLTLQFAAAQFLVMRAGVVAQLGADHLMAARTRGLSDRMVCWRHAARPALLPAVSLIGVQAGVAIAATVVVETVFRYEGIGRLVFDAVRYRDYPTLQGCFLVLTLMVIVANLLTELAYRWIDPRVAA